MSFLLPFLLKSLFFLFFLFFPSFLLSLVLASLFFLFFPMFLDGLCSNDEFSLLFAMCFERPNANIQDFVVFACIFSHTLAHCRLERCFWYTPLRILPDGLLLQITIVRLRLNAFKSEFALNKKYCSPFEHAYGNYQFAIQWESFGETSVEIMRSLAAHQLPYMLYGNYQFAIQWEPIW